MANDKVYIYDEENIRIEVYEEPQTNLILINENPSLEVVRIYEQGPQGPKGDNSTLPSNIISSSQQIASDISGSWLFLQNKTGSYATTGSNTFIGNQVITGSANISGSLAIGVVSSSTIPFELTGKLRINTLSSPTASSWIEFQPSTNTVSIAGSTVGNIMVFSPVSNTLQIQQPLSLGSATVTSTDKLNIRASSNNTTTYGLKVLQNNLSSSFLVRDDGTVAVATSTHAGLLTIGPSSGTMPSLVIHSGSLVSNPFGGSIEYSSNKFSLSYYTTTYGAVRRVHFGNAISDDYTGLYLGNATPSSTNYTVAGNASLGILNGGVITRLAVNNAATLEQTNALTTIYTATTYVSGNLGVGTNSPSQILDVKPVAGSGGIRITSHNSTTEALRLRSNANGGGDIVLNNSAGSTTTVLSGVTNNDSYISNGGKFGIGTSSPTKRLEVYDSASGDGLGVVRSAVTTQRIEIIPNDNTISALIKGGGNDKPFYIASWANGGTAQPLYFGTNYSSGLNEVRMTITPSGSVGIGTISPSRSLEVVDANNSQLRLTQTGGTNYAEFFVDNTGKLNISSSALRIQTHGDIYMTDLNKTLQVGSAITSVSSNMSLTAGANISFIKGATGQFSFGSNADSTATSGNVYTIYTNPAISHSFRPNTGSATYTELALNPTVSQSAQATGTTWGINLNTNILAATDWRSIQWNNSIGYGLYGSGTANNYLAGKLGIGTASPSATLHISGSSGSGLFKVGSDYNPNIFYISGSGNIGIGTSNPVAKVEIDANSTGTVPVMQLRTNSTSTGDSLQFYYNSGIASRFDRFGKWGLGVTSPVGAIHIVPSYFSSGQDGLIVDGTSLTVGDVVQIKNTSGLPALYVKSSGAVGIGTATPSTKLQISGSSGSALLQIDSDSNSNIVFVSGSGNIGIGNPIPTNKLDVEGIIGAGILSGSGELRSYQSTNLYVSVKTSSPKSGLFRSNTDFFVYYNTSNGNTVMDATFGGSSNVFHIQGTEKMRLDNSGRLGIGTSTPNYNLDVSGSTNVGGGLFVSGALNVYTSGSTIRLPLTLDSTGIADGTNALVIKAQSGATTGIIRNNGTAQFNDTVAVGYLSGISSNPIRGNANWVFGSLTQAATGRVRIIASTATTSSYALRVDTSDTSASFAVRDDGMVSIGPATASALLHISGSTLSKLLQISSPATSNILVVSGSGNVGVNMLAPAYPLDVNGTFRATSILVNNGSTGISVSSSYLQVHGTSGVTLTTWTGSSGYVHSVNIVPNTGYVGIQKLNPQYELDVSGSINASNNLTVTGSFRGSVRTLSISNLTASMDLSTGNFFDLTLSGSATVYLNPTNIQAGQTVNLRVIQPVTTGSLVYGSSIKFEGGTPYSVSATGSAVDILTFITFDSVSLYGSVKKGFS